MSPSPPQPCNAAGSTPSHRLSLVVCAVVCFGLGAGYSSTTLKTQLKMAVQRLMMHRNKKSNSVSVDSKQVAILLQQSKDESARIRCEAIIHEKNLITAMELLTLMCELLVARTQLITASKVCPVDLEEGIASIIYCASRVEIPELKTIAEQFGSKYGKDWASRHADNASLKVNQRIIDKLSIQPPPFEVVLNMLHEIAATYSVEWKPDMAALESGIVDHSNPERLGSIARIPAPAGSSDAVQPPPPPPNNVSLAQPAALAGSAPPQYPLADPHLATPSLDAAAGSPSPFPGTLNLIIHRGRNILNLASQSDPHDLYVRLTNLNTGVTWKSDPDPYGGNNPVWHNNPKLPGLVHHFPVSVQDATTQIQIEIFQKNSGTFGIKDDRLLGQINLYADNLRANPQLQWYGLYLQSMQIGFLLMATQYLPLNASILSKDEIEQQRAWLADEDRRRHQQLNSPESLIPGGPHLPHGGADVAASSSSLPVDGGASSSSSLVDEPGAPPSHPPASRQSFGDRVESLFREPEESPPHDHSKNLSDIMRQQQNTNNTQTTNGTATTGTSADPAETNYEESFDLPSVPTHSAGSGRSGQGNSGSRGSSGGGGGGGHPSSSSGGGSGGLCGTVYARPPPKRDQDDDLEARLKRLNQ